MNTTNQRRALRKPEAIQRLRLISKIAGRAQRLFFDAGVSREHIDCMMDIEAADADVGLDLDKLLEFDDGDFSHDVGGIARHLNHETGKLEACFLPRCALRQPPGPENLHPELPMFLRRQAT